MGRIELSGMRFYAYHGCLESERRLGAEYMVDFSCETSIHAASRSDNLADTVDYSRIYAIVAREMETPSNLLEHVVGRIADSIRASFPQLESIEVRVSKKNPPVGGECEWARVTVRR